MSVWKGPEYTASVASAKTDDNGNFAFPEIGAGDYRVVPSHPEYTFSPPFAAVTLKPEAPLAAASFTAQAGSVLRVVLSPMGTQMPPPNSLGAIAYEESPSFMAPNASGIAMANKEADGNFYIPGLLLKNRQYYQLCPVAREYLFIPECAAVTTPGGPGIVSLSFNYKPR